MKIAIDGRVLLYPPTGIGNLLISALNELSSQNPDWEFYVLINRNIHPEALVKLKNKNIFIIQKPLFVLKNIALLWYFTKVYFVLNELKPDYFWAPANILPPVIPRGIRTILTINDLLSKKFPNTMRFPERVYHKLFFDRSIRMAGILWSNSNHTTQEIETYFPDRKCQYIFTGLSIDKSIYKQIYLTSQDREKLLKKYNLGNKFILFVGAIVPRKNLKFLLSLMPELVKDDFELLIVGAKGWGKTEVENIINLDNFPRDKVRFAGYVSTQDLVKLYNIASVYVFTSIYEGFGLPILEAMACGCPVVTAHNSAMIEVVEGGGKTVMGWDKGEWINAIKEVYSNRDKYIKSGREKAMEYDWQKVIKKLSMLISH